MTDDMTGGESHATVRTDRPERYGKQLVSHLGRRNGGEWTRTHDPAGSTWPAAAPR